MRRRISNKTKDTIILSLIIFTILFAIFGFGVAVVKCFAETERQISEYRSRPTIIRAETNEDRNNDEIWRKQYKEQYGIEYCEWED